MNDRETLARELTALGLAGRSPLMVHASLRRIGPIDGGAHALLDAIGDALGAGGTIVMPLGGTDDAPFDALGTPAEADIGVLAEVFRRRPGTQVNDHAAGRFGAAGPDAAAILEPMPLHDYLGEGTALARFVDAGGWVLRLGANVDTITVTHLAEYRADVPHKRRVRRRYVRADTGEQWIESLDDSAGIVEGEGGDYFAELAREFLASGRARVGTVGGCTAELFDGRAFVAFAVDWLESHLGRE